MPSFSITSHVQLFAFNVDKIGGYLVDASLGGEYEVVDDLFIELSYAYYKVSAGYGDDSLDLNASFEFYGSMAMLTYHF